MKHYGNEELRLYKEDKIEFEKSQQIEDHLIDCDQCLHNFLSLIDKNEIQQSEEIVSPDFENKVMNKIQEKNITVKKKKQTFFIYYTAAAVVTLALTGIGIFDTLISIVPEMTQTAVIREDQRIRPDAIYNWTQQITDKTSHFIYNFEINDIKEERK